GPGRAVALLRPARSAKNFRLATARHDPEADEGRPQIATTTSSYGTSARMSALPLSPKPRYMRCHQRKRLIRPSQKWAFSKRDTASNKQKRLSSQTDSAAAQELLLWRFYI
ncbi:MAG: hypothetical protein WB806_00375, partial [Xanthobacteraceae bacterium]